MDEKYGGEISRELQVTVDRVEYDCKTGIGRVFMPSGCCVDMNGTIALFERLDSSVQKIETFAGDEPDTFYRRIDSGRWEAC